MDEQLMLEQLEALAKGLEIEVRYETLRKETRFNPGGLCRIRGLPVIIINRKAPVRDQVEVLAAAIHRFDLGSIYLRPGLREFLETISPGGTVDESQIEAADDNDDNDDA